MLIFLNWSVKDAKKRLHIFPFSQNVSFSNTIFSPYRAPKKSGDVFLKKHANQVWTCYSTVWKTPMITSIARITLKYFGSPVLLNVSIFYPVGDMSTLCYPAYTTSLFPSVPSLVSSCFSSHCSFYPQHTTFSHLSLFFPFLFLRL